MGMLKAVWVISWRTFADIHPTRLVLSQDKRFAEKSYLSIIIRQMVVVLVVENIVIQFYLVKILPVLSYIFKIFIVNIRPIAVFVILIVIVAGERHH